MKRANIALLPAIAFTALMGLSTSALAGPIWIFSTSVGTQPSNAGVITLTQHGANSVDVSVDLVNPTYGFLNTGGPHTPFAFTLAGSGALSISFTTPVGGHYTHGTGGTFSLNTAGGMNNPYGSYGVAIDDTAHNGSVNAYFGDLLFTLTRSTPLSTDDFIANANGYFFSADLTNGTNTGAQAWNVGIDPPVPETKVPEPLTLSLFGAGFAGLVAARRRRKVAQA